MSDAGVSILHGLLISLNISPGYRLLKNALAFSLTQITSHPLYALSSPFFPLLKDEDPSFTFKPKPTTCYSFSPSSFLCISNPSSYNTRFYTLSLQSIFPPFQKHFPYPLSDSHSHFIFSEKFLKRVGFGC